MFYFKRFISYIDYFENGEKIKNAGHAKVIIEDKKCTLDIHVKGLEYTGSLTVLIQTLQGVTLGRMQLAQGMGSYEATYMADDMDGLGTSIEAITGLQIPVTESCYCKTVWKKENPVVQDEVVVKEQPIVQKLTVRQVEASEKKPQKKVVEKGQTDKEETMLTEGEIMQPEMGDAVLVENSKHVNLNEDMNKDTLYADKWRQLCHIYKMVHPFADEDEFISIEPKDFVIMRQEYQHLVNNSFLLHGFYNYRHVILGKRKDSKHYYIGVPGTYYDREKMVAVMFGFEGFEPSGDEVIYDSIEQGTYGYYMRKVEI